MIYLIFFSVCCGLCLRLVASKRNADKRFWLIMGIVFGPFALPFVFFSKAIPETIKHEETTEIQPSRQKMGDA